MGHCSLEKVLTIFHFRIGRTAYFSEWQIRKRMKVSRSLCFQRLPREEHSYRHHTSSPALANFPSQRARVCREPAGACPRPCGPPAALGPALGPRLSWDLQTSAFSRLPCRKSVSSLSPRVKQALVAVVKARDGGVTSALVEVTGESPLPPSSALVPGSGAGSMCVTIQQGRCLAWTRVCWAPTAKCHGLSSWLP